MAAITITPGSVVAGTNASKASGVAGEAITAGQAVYLDSTNQKWMKADANDTAVKSGVGTSYGIALTGSDINQPIVVDTMDQAGIAIGGTTVAGTVYVISATAGGICPWSDLLSGEFVTIIGVGAPSNKIIFMGSGATGVAKA